MLIKRLFDIIFSFIGLFLLLPLFLLVAFLIKIDSPGYIFFRQQRIGRNFIPFFIYKFRTMTTDAPQSGPEITVGGDKRVTRIGRLLRKSKIDELPQLINVLKGDMSFVGPRPEVPKYVEFYRDEYKIVLGKRPGITDIASIIFRDEESVLKNQNDPDWYYKHVLLPEKIKLAKEYIKRASLLYDMKLIFTTFLRLFKHNSPEGYSDIIKTKL